MLAPFCLSTYGMYERLQYGPMGAYMVSQAEFSAIRGIAMHANRHVLLLAICHAAPLQTLVLC